MRILPALLLLITLPLAGCYDSEDLNMESQHLVDEAAVTSGRMFSDTDFGKLVELSSRARGLLIFPNVLRAAFIFGGRGGNGVLVARDPGFGGWSNPAFYTIGGVNWGLQVGGQQQAIIVAIMTERGLNSVINRRATLGADASIAAGELGKAITAQTGADWKADMYAFAKSEGAFVGIALEGSIIWPRHEWNQQYYGQGASPEGILLQRSFTNPQAARLVGAMP